MYITAEIQDVLPSRRHPLHTYSCFAWTSDVNADDDDNDDIDTNDYR